MPTEIIENQIRWVAHRFGLTVDRARLLVGLAFANGRAA
jgi:hypothetical protein